MTTRGLGRGGCHLYVSIPLNTHSGLVTDIKIEQNEQLKTCLDLYKVFFKVQYLASTRFFKLDQTQQFTSKTFYRSPTDILEVQQSIKSSFFAMTDPP